MLVGLSPLLGPSKSKLCRVSVQVIGDIESNKIHIDLLDCWYVGETTVITHVGLPVSPAPDAAWLIYIRITRSGL